MVKLLDYGDNILTRVQSTDAITAGSVLKSAKKRADKLSTTTGKTVLPTFTTQTEAQEEADRLNVINQSVIGAKEGVVEVVSKMVSSNITVAILQTANDSNHKSIDNFTLYKVMKVAIDRADRPSIRTWHGWPRMAVSLVSHSSCSHCWPTLRRPPNPIMDVILLGHARHPQEIRILSGARCNVAPNHFNGARGS
jgi:hypothetical protein